MYKTSSLQVRLPGKTHGDFMDHWLHVHAPKSAGITEKDGLYGYVANEALRDATPDYMDRLEIAIQADGVAQLWFDQPDGLMAMGKIPAVQAWFADGPNYCGNRVGLTVLETVLARPDRAQAGAKAFLFIQLAGEGYGGLKAGLETRPEAASGLCGAVLSEVIALNASVNLPAFEAPRIDALLELWAPDEKALAAGMRALWDANLLSAAAKINVLLAAEHVVRLPVTQM